MEKEKRGALGYQDINAKVRRCKGKKIERQEGKKGRKTPEERVRKEKLKSGKQGRIHGTRCALYAFFSPSKITGDRPTDLRTDLRTDGRTDGHTR